MNLFDVDLNVEAIDTAPVEKPKNYFQDLAAKQEAKALADINVTQNQRNIEAHAKSQKLAAIAHTPMNAKQWEEIYKTDPKLRWDEDAKKVRLHHRKILGMLFDCK